MFIRKWLLKKKFIRKEKKIEMIKWDILRGNSIIKRLWVLDKFYIKGICLKCFYLRIYLWIRLRFEIIIFSLNYFG